MPLFYYFTVQSHLLCVWESKVPFITFWIFNILRFKLAIQDSHPCLYCTKTWYHSGSLQKMLTALFNLV